MERGAFFLRPGFGRLSDLLDLVYSVAHFWGLDPFVVMARTIDDVLEMNGQAHRIHNASQD